MSDKKKYLIKDDKSLAGIRVDETPEAPMRKKKKIVKDDDALFGHRIEDLPEGLKKDTTTGFGANITVEGKSMGGEVEVGKGKDYIADLIK